MSRRKALLGLVISGLIALAGVVIDLRIVSGYVIGAGISVLLYLRTVSFCDQVLEERRCGAWGMFGHFLFSYLLMVLPLLISVLAPELFNVFAAALGLLLMKLVLILDSILERREKDG